MPCQATLLRIIKIFHFVHHVPRIQTIKLRQLLSQETTYYLIFNKMKIFK
jgi:hypothetical protein